MNMKTKRDTVLRVLASAKCGLRRASTSLLRLTNYAFAISMILTAAVRAKDEVVTPSSWQFAAGAAVVNSPRYPGSQFESTRALPIFSVQYGRFFVGALPGSGLPAGLGVYVLRDEHFQLGVGVGGDFRKPRRASDDPVLRGWGDIATTPRATVFASYNLPWLSIRGAAAQDAGGKHEGLLASFEIDGKYRLSEALTLTAGPQLAWGNNSYNQTFFGVTVAQATIAGISAHEAKSGLNTAAFSVGANYVLTSKWSVALHMAFGRLQGDAADSPVTTDKNQRVLAVFTVYRF